MSIKRIGGLKWLSPSKWEIRALLGIEEEKAAMGAESQRKDFMLEVRSKAYCYRKTAIGRESVTACSLPPLSLQHTETHTPLCAY